MLNQLRWIKKYAFSGKNCFEATKGNCMFTQHCTFRQEKCPDSSCLTKTFPIVLILPARCAWIWITCRILHKRRRSDILMIRHLLIHPSATLDSLSLGLKEMLLLKIFTQTGPTWVVSVIATAAAYVGKAMTWPSQTVCIKVMSY